MVTLIKWSSFQKARVNLHQKRYMRLAPGQAKFGIMAVSRMTLNILDSQTFFADNHIAEF
jgi:hypothetical protein